MKQANVEQIIINEDYVHVRVWKRLIAHGMIIDVEKLVYINGALFYLIIGS